MTSTASMFGDKKMEPTRNITHVHFDGGGALLMDDIQFPPTPAAVPEPPLGLLLLAGMWGLLRNRHRSP